MDSGSSSKDPIIEVSDEVALAELEKLVISPETPEEEASRKEKREMTFLEAQRRLADLNKKLGRLGEDQQILFEKHAFWDTQPVTKIMDKVGESGPIDRVKTVEEVQKEPYALPEGFSWVECNIDDTETMDRIYNLLCEHYVEDDDNMFRFAYPKEFLQWALKPPGFRRDWHIGVTVQSTNKLVGFITAIPVIMSVDGSEIRMVEINFLCVHKKLRTKRLAPVLIKEITRRVNLTGTWQAVYTAGRLIPTPTATCQYYHRSLNPEKLIAIRFSRVPPQFEKFKEPMKMTKRFYGVADAPAIKGLRPLRAADVRAACALLGSYLSKFRFHMVFTEEEFAHWFLPRAGVIDSYVVENPKTHEITDLISFYTLPSSIIGHEKYKSLKAAYAFYNVATSVPIKELMTDALVLAQKTGFDVFNALDLMENAQFLRDLKFGEGDGFLRYYFFNWRCPPMESADVGLVML